MIETEELTAVRHRIHPLLMRVADGEATFADVIALATRYRDAFRRAGGNTGRPASAQSNSSAEEHLYEIDTDTPVIFRDGQRWRDLPTGLDLEDYGRELAGLLITDAVNSHTAWLLANDYARSHRFGGGFSARASDLRQWVCDHGKTPLWSVPCAR